MITDSSESESASILVLWLAVCASVLRTGLVLSNDGDVGRVSDVCFVFLGVVVSPVVKCAYSMYSAQAGVLVPPGVALWPPSRASPISDASGGVFSGDSSGVLSSWNPLTSPLFGVAEPSGCDGFASRGGVLSLGVADRRRCSRRFGDLSHAYSSLLMFSHSSLSLSVSPP